MKKTILILLCFLFSLSINSQDIVYDTLKGNRENWLKVYVGYPPILEKTYFENLGILSKSKIVVASGDLQGLTPGEDYQDYYYDNDIMTHEYKTDTTINMILYKYYHTSTQYYSYLGFRKPGVSRDVFDGQYILICPITRPETVIRVYEGIGSSKRLFKTFRLSDINESSYYDWDLPSEITIESSYLSRWIRFARVDLEDGGSDIHDLIKVWPNPTTGSLKIFLPNPDNKTFIIRIYSLNVSLLYQGYMRSEFMTIDISSYPPGSYYILFFDEYGNFIRPINIIKVSP